MLSQNKDNDQTNSLVEEIVKTNGGIQGYEKLVIALVEDGKENDAKATQMKNIIEQDY